MIKRKLISPIIMLFVFLQTGCLQENSLNSSDDKSKDQSPNRPSNTGVGNTGNNGNTGNTVPPQALKTLADSGLAASIYNVIATEAITITQKNNIIDAVKLAIDNQPVQLDRDNAITLAVTNNVGINAALANSIKDQVDIEHPIANVPPQALKTLVDSGLALSIYNVIINGAITITQKNNIIDAVKLAIDNQLVQLNRDNAITLAVTNNVGINAVLANSIKYQVDIEHPILKTQADSGLAASIYNVIINAAINTTQKNNIIDAVKLAIDNQLVQLNRDNAINLAVTNNVGINAVLANSIKYQVDIEHPILKTQADSGLAASIYNVIINGAINTTQKNNIIDAVKAAIDNQLVQLNRDNAITLAVTNNVGINAVLANSIKDKVDIEHPIAPAGGQLTTIQAIIDEASKGALADISLVRKGFDSLVVDFQKAHEITTAPPLAAGQDRFVNFLASMPASKDTLAIFTGLFDLMRTPPLGSATKVKSQINLIGTSVTPIQAMLGNRSLLVGEDPLYLEKIITLMVKYGGEDAVKAADISDKLNLMLDSILANEVNALAYVFINVAPALKPILKQWVNNQTPDIITFFASINPETEPLPPGGLVPPPGYVFPNQPVQPIIAVPSLALTPKPTQFSGAIITINKLFSYVSTTPDSALLVAHFQRNSTYKVLNKINDLLKSTLNPDPIRFDQYLAMMPVDANIVHFWSIIFQTFKVSHKALEKTALSGIIYSDNGPFVKMIDPARITGNGEIPSHRNKVIALMVKNGMDKFIDHIDSEAKLNTILDAVLAEDSANLEAVIDAIEKTANNLLMGQVNAWIEVKYATNITNYKHILNLTRYGLPSINENDFYLLVKNTLTDKIITKYLLANNTINGLTFIYFLSYMTASPKISEVWQLLCDRLGRPSINKYINIPGDDTNGDAIKPPLFNIINNMTAHDNEKLKIINLLLNYSVKENVDSWLFLYPTNIDLLLDLIMEEGKYEDLVQAFKIIPLTYFESWAMSHRVNIIHRKNGDEAKVYNAVSSSKAIKRDNIGDEVIKNDPNWRKLLFYVQVFVNSKENAQSLAEFYFPEPNIPGSNILLASYIAYKPQDTYNIPKFLRHWFSYLINKAGNTLNRSSLYIVITEGNIEGNIHSKDAKTILQTLNPDKASLNLPDDQPHPIKETLKIFNPTIISDSYIQGKVKSDPIINESL